MRVQRPGVVDVVDETFVRAEPLTVRAALEEPGVLDRLWPGLQREVAQDRGAKGVRWWTRGEVTGRLEIWLEEVPGGTIVHHFIHGEQQSGRRGWEKRHRRRWKDGVHEIKDRLEGRRR
ncbi:polyketide cyclase / dehydrase and lipid transport [Janibacter cremeus]|uniref:Polyketide cyclase / dehydrase and lipid transport n=1 Tax=Janibacter cremeus TaxID=1285192 RepID=A0A852VI91_9MICO|nr:polyketide cyclase / dehydrase and lipid transport [Janibacter cremeus]NYF96817.1 hypothetical protein [Janibacter cremeus]